MKKGRLSKIVGIAFLVLVFAMTAFYFWLYPPYPSKQDVDKALSDIRTEKSPEKRTRITADMLYSLHDPRSVEHDMIMVGFLRGLEKYFLKTGDQAVLNAVDACKIDGGFATDVCGFYRNISKWPGFANRYRKPEHFMALDRCRGIIFDNEDVARMLNAR